MYLGMILMLIGVALLMGSIAPYSIIPVFIIIIDKTFIRTEEDSLDRQFGRAWIEYRDNVRRWL